MNKSLQIAQVARSLVGKSCYVWGAKGQDLCSKNDLLSWLKSMEQADSGYTKEQNIQRVVNLFNKLKDQGINPIRGFDCSGLVFYVYKECGVVYIRRSAASYYSRCTPKTRDQLCAGDLVFKETNGKITHVGMYLGNKRVIHAKGRDLGIIEESLDAYPWNRYGKLSGTYDEKDEQKDTVDTTPIAVQTSINGPYVQTDGSVYVRTRPDKKRGVILGVARNQKLEYLGQDEETGWYIVKYKDGTAYITNNEKYTTLVK